MPNEKAASGAKPLAAFSHSGGLFSLRNGLSAALRQALHISLKLLHPHLAGLQDVVHIRQRLARRLMAREPDGVAPCGDGGRCAGDADRRQDQHRHPSPIGIIHRNQDLPVRAGLMIRGRIVAEVLAPVGLTRAADQHQLVGIKECTFFHRRSHLP